MLSHPRNDKSGAGLLRVLICSRNDYADNLNCHYYKSSLTSLQKVSISVQTLFSKETDKSQYLSK